MEFKTLQNVPVETLYDIFIDAFLNYEVKMEISIPQFSRMIYARNYDPDSSIGCFIENRLVGFTLCGIRNYGGTVYGYDIATGVLNDHQHKGIGREILHRQIALLKSNGVKYFKLEVLEKNTAAVKLYKNEGFNVIRKLECYEANKDELIFTNKAKCHFNNNLSKFARLNTKEFDIFKPTWQNDLVSVGNTIDHLHFWAIEKNNQMICYGLINRETGRILQIGILPEWRNQGMEAILISQLAKFTTNEKVSFINVEACSYLSETLDNIGIIQTTNQYEMQLDL